MKDLVSIVVPVYNKEKYIRKCLESIAKQVYSRIQVIIIDDGSTDESLKVIDEMIKNDTRFEVHSQSNKGAAIARNYGLSFVEGKYVAFIDGDDYVKPNFIKKLLEYKNYDLVISGYCQVENNRRINTIIPEQKIIDKDHLKDYLFNESNFNYCALVWNKLFRTDIIKENNIRFENLEIAEDTIFVFNYFKYCKKIIAIKETDYCNVIVSNTLSRKWIKNLWNLMLRVEEEVKNIFELNYDKYWNFLMLKLIKITLGNYSINYYEFKKVFKIIKGSSQFKKMSLKCITSIKNKVLFILMKLNCNFLLFKLFNYKNNYRD